MFCPNCAAEYKQGIDRCTDCGAALVARVESTKPGQSAWRRFLDAPSATRAQIDLDQHPLPDAHALVEQWDELRRSQTLYFIVVTATLAYFAVQLGLRWWIGYNSLVRQVMMAISIPLLLGGWIAAGKHRRFLCPRCRQRDTFRTRFLSLPARRCLRCGLEKGYVPSV